MAAVLLTPPNLQFLDDNGDPVAGGFVYTYAAGTMTPKATYTDYTGGTPASNPVELDAAGRPETIGAIWLEEGGAYKFVVTDADLVEVGEPIDNVTAFSTASGLDVLGDIAANTIVGNNTGAPATPTALTVAEVLAMLSISSASGYKNQIINGAFNVWQRNATAGTYALTTTAAYGSADRWGATMQTSAAGIFNRDTSITAGLGFQYNAKVGRTAASALTNAIIIGQALETINSIPLAGQTVTLSFYAKAGANYSAASSELRYLLRGGTGTNESFANAIVGAWTGASAPINVGATLTTSWQRFQTTVTLATSITQLCVDIRYTPVGTAGADDNFYITGVQLEIGSTASAFEARPFGVELGLCQRYYEKSFIYSTTPAQNVSTVGAVTVYLPTGASGTFGTTVPMIAKRTAPTIVTYNTSAANADWRDVTNSADRTATVSPIGESSFVVSGAAGVAASANRIQWAASAEL